MLSAINAHPRDSRIQFDEPTHIYTIDGSSEDYISVTKLVHKCFEEFNADEVISKTMKSRNWPNSPWHGMSRQEIKDAWEKSGKEASDAGTLMHANIENFYNGEPYETESKEWKLFSMFREARPALKPFRSEMIVFDTDAKIAGSIDKIYHDPQNEGSFLIYDWKRSKEIKMENRWQSGTHPLTEEFPDCNFIHYSLQLSIYKYILEKLYGMKITGCYLVILHPSQSDFIELVAQDLTHVAEGLFKERLELFKDKENREPEMKKLKA